MTPLSVANVAGRSGEFRLERKTVPCHVCILTYQHRCFCCTIIWHSVDISTHTREPDWISVTSRTRVPRERESSIASPCLVDEMVVVQDPQRVDTLDFRVRALLPIQPPEVNSLIFERVMQCLEVFLEELLVGTLERDRLGGVSADMPREEGIGGTYNTLGGIPT